MSEKKKPWRVLGLREINQFIEDQAKDSDSSSTKSLSEKGTDVSNLIDDEPLNSSSQNDESFHRKVDNIPEAEKTFCNNCQKLVNKHNYARHRKSCFSKIFCQYCDKRVRKDVFKDHLQKGCQACTYCSWCDKVFEKEEIDPDHKYHCEVNWRLNDLRQKTKESELKELQMQAIRRLQEYEEYKKFCQEKKFFPRKLERWCKENKNLEDKLIEVIIMESKGKDSNRLNEKETSAEKIQTKKKEDQNKGKKKPKKVVKKQKEKPVEKPKQKSRKRKRGDEIEEEENERQQRKKRKKPSSIFHLVLSLPVLWIFNILKLSITKTNCGYRSPSRKSKGWRCLQRTQGSLLPYTYSWSWHQRTALRKKTKFRDLWRKQRNRIVRNIMHLSHFSWRNYQEFLGLVSSTNLWKQRYFRKKWIPGYKIFQEIVMSKENGLDAEPHIHMFIRTTQPILFETLRKYFRRFKYKGTSILRTLEICKSAKTILRYITKEDYSAYVYQVDKEQLNNNFIMFNFAKQSDRIHPGQYAYYRWNNISQRNKYIEIHDWYWKKYRQEECYKLAMNCVNLYTLECCKTTNLKGIYIYGESGTGKSTLAFAISGGDYYMVTESVKFAFNTWYGEKYILFEDFTKLQLMKYRLTINQLTDMFGMTTCERKGANHVVVTCEKVIITSNEPPPTEDEWKGFSRRFRVIKADGL